MTGNEKMGKEKNIAATEKACKDFHFDQRKFRRFPYNDGLVLSRQGADEFMF